MSPAGRVAFNTYSVYSQGVLVWNTPPSNEQNIWPFLCGERGSTPNGGGCWWQVMPDDIGGQKLVIEWKGTTRWAVADDDFNFQLWLHDNGDVSAHYGHMSAVTTHHDTLFSFMMVAGNAQSGGYYIDRVMLNGQWNAPVIVTENTMPAYGHLFQGNIGAHLTGLPDSGLLLTYQRPLPPCPNPRNIAVRAIGSESATIGWDASNPASGGSVTYILEYDTMDFTPGTGSHNYTTVSDSVCMLTGLAPSHHYWLYVKAQCSSDTSRWRALEFETPCMSMTHADLPYTAPMAGYTYSYSMGTYPMLPCWLRSGTAHVTTNNSVTSLYIQHDSNSVAILPRMDYVHDLHLTFDHYGNPVTVGVMENPYDISTFTAVAEVPYENVRNNYDISLRSYRGTGRFVALRGHEGSIGANFHSFGLYAYTGCQPVDYLTVAALTPSTATLQWSDPDEIGSYKVVYWAAGGAPDSVTVTDTTATLTGLTTGTSYSAAVITLCADGTSSVADTILFTPNCAAPVSVSVDSLTGYAARFVWNDDYGAGTYLVTLYDADTVPIGIDSVSGATFTWFGGLSPRTSYFAGVRRLCPAGWTDETMGHFLTDYGCKAPDSISVIGVNDTGATIVVHRSAGAGSYVLLLTYNGVTDTLYAASDTVAIGGLLSSTGYTLAVYTLCTDSTLSASSSIMFSTPCAVIQHGDLPYVETFDHCTNGDEATLNPCWNVYTFAPSNFVGMYYPTNQQHNGVSGNSLYILPRYNNQPGFIVLPEVDRLDDISLNFWLYCPWAGDDRVDIGVMSDPGDTTTFTALQSFTPYVRNQWLQVEVPLGTYTGTGRYPALRCGVNGSTFGDPLYFDDVTLRVNVACGRPDSLFVTDVEPWSATLHIVPSSLGDSAAMYQVIVASATGSDTMMVTSDTVLLSSLQQATDYTVAVRSVCSDSAFTLATFMEFATPCGAYAIPWYEDFEQQRNGYVPRCWEVMDTLCYRPNVRQSSSTSFTSYSGQRLLSAVVADTGSYTWFATPEFQPFDGPVAITFQTRAYEYRWHVDTMPVNLEISLLGDSTTVLYNRKVLFSDWTPLEVVAPRGLLASGGRFVFRMWPSLDTTLAYTSVLLLDEVAVVPLCLPVEALEVVTLDTVPPSLEAHWQPQGVESQWEVAVWNDTFSVSVLVATPYLTLTEGVLLSDSTDYLLAVRPVCSEGDTGYWSDTVAFRTPDPYHPEGIGNIADRRMTMMVYPNPASHMATVECIACEAGCTLTLTDAVGRVVAMFGPLTAGKLEIDLSGVAPGVYFLRLSDGAAVAKLIVR